MLVRGPCQRCDPAFDDAAIGAAGDRAKAVWTAESGRERDRLLRLPAPARLAALDDEESRGLLTSDHRAEIRASLVPATAEQRKEETRRIEWEIERRRLLVVHTLRPMAAAGCAVAATLPFLIAAWRRDMGVDDAFTAFATPGWPLLGTAVALIAAVILGRQVGKANGLEGLVGLVVAAFAAGVAGLAVSLGLVF